MAVTGIRLFGASCLRQRAVEADPTSPGTAALLDTLWDTLSDDGGVGLAAPQIGALQRVVVVRDPDRPEGQQRLDLVNPVVEATFGAEEVFEEGCLSFPGLYTDIVRPQGVVLSYSTPASGAKRLQLRNRKLLARIVLHEVDHLDGILFIDYLSALERWLLAPKLLWIMGRRLLRG